MSWTQTVPYVTLVVHCSPSVKPFHFLFLHPHPSRPSDSLLLPFSLSAPSHIYSSFLHWVDDSLVFESCAFCSMICSVVSLLLPGLSLFLLLLHPGSQPTLTYVPASYVLISNLTMLLTLITSSPELFVTLLATPKHPIPLPQSFLSLSLSLHPTICYHTTRPPRQDFLGQVHCTLGEIVGSPASRLEKSLGWVWPLTCPKMSTSHLVVCDVKAMSKHPFTFSILHVLKSQLVWFQGRVVHVFDFC